MHPDTRCRSTLPSRALRSAVASGADQPATLSLRLFGYPEVRLAGRPVHFARRASLALLAFLALRPRTHQRAALVALIGGRMSDAQRLLRSALAELTDQLGDLLVLTPETVALNPQRQIVVDVAQLEQAFVRARASGESAPLREAVEQCRYEFLEGFTVNASLAFDEWLVCERERLHGLLIQALEWLCNHYACTGDAAACLPCARRLVTLEAWHEGAHCDVMLLLASAGQPAAALEQYETCRRVLAEEFGIAPGPATQSLYERVHAPWPPRHNLAPEPTAFIGRRRELARLVGLLDDPECRLITVSGPGGIGKTRLALHAAIRYAGNGPTLHWRRFPDGVWLAALDALEARSGEDMAACAQRVFAAVASAFSLDVPPGSSAEGPLLAHLHDRELLLVLDNLEHLPGAEPAIRRILAATTRVTLLATTRLCCGVQPGSCIELGPMDLPADAATIDKADAGALFLSQARQKVMGFKPDEGDLAAIVQICAATGGLPLAIVLAADQLRVASCAALAEQLARGALLDLATAVRNLPPRHRSLRANLAYNRQVRNPAVW